MRPLAIIGPTGAGKSQLALDVAARLGARVSVEIVNADAMQLYRGMDIGTAKLPVSERRGIPHHQLDVLDVTETATVARYQRAAAADIEAIAARGAVPVVVGGSMLYVQSLLDDWSFSRNRSFSTREMGAASGRGRGGSAARRVSPPRPGCSRGNPAHRCPAHGAGARGGRTHRAAICRVRATHRCAAVGHGYRRVGLSDNDSRRAVGPSHRLMFDQGLVEEVRTLLRNGLREGVTASRALGYAQVIAALDAGAGADMMRAAREQTYLGTRRYVRRQRSWFRRDHRVHWLDAGVASSPDRARLVDDAVRLWRHVT